jgi:hypothetical protein
VASTVDPHPATGGYRNAPVSAPAPPGAPAGSPGSGFSTDGVVVVDPDQIRIAAAGFRRVAEDVRSAVQDAMNRTQGGSLGAAPWGSDPLGKSFEAQYVPVVQPFTEALNQLHDLFDGLADRLTSAAADLTGSEDTAVRLTSDFANRLASTT